MKLPSFRSSKVLGTAALVFLHGAGAFASPMSWQQLVEKVKSNNEELQASERRLVSSAHRVSAAYGAFWPALSASLSRTQTGSQATAPATTEDYALSLNVTENLFAGFQDEASLKISRTNLQAAEINLQIAKAQVSYDLKSAVSSLIYAQSYLDLATSIIERRELNLRLVQLRFDGGRENKGSLLLSKANLEEAKVDHLEAEQNLISARSELAKVLGISAGEIETVSDRVPVTAAPSEPSDDEFEKLVEASPTYRTALTTEVLAQAAVTQAEAGFYPSLNLTASAIQSGPSWYPAQDRWTVGASLTLPLFNGGKDYYGTKAASEALHASSLARSTVLRDQMTQLKTAYGNYAKVVQRLRIDEMHLRAAELREKISRQKYNNGLSTFEDWDLIETELIKRQKNFILSERDRVLTEATWEQTQGKGVF
jgi:outer membrane protein TolC